MRRKKAIRDLLAELKISSFPPGDPVGVLNLLILYYIRFKNLKKKYNELKFRMDGLEK